MKTVYSTSIVSTFLATDLMQHSKLNNSYVLENVKHSYKPHPWARVYYPDIVIIETKPQSFDVFVEYYASEKHMATDRKTQQKIVRYLTRNYPHLLTGQVSKIVEYIKDNLPATIHFTKDGADSVRVYSNGPSSCMSHDISDYASSPHHPAIAYDITKGDVCVAYVMKGDRITARAMCCPSKKIYGRVYGDSSAFTAGMKAIGFSKEHSEFIGCVLPYIPMGNGFVFPYVDSVEYVSVLANQKQVVLHNRYNGSDVSQFTLYETHDCKSQNGITPEYEDENQCYCEHCSDYCESSSYIENYGDVCDYCLENSFNNCDECHSTHHDLESVSNENGDLVFCSSSCYSENFERCDECDKEVDSGDLSDANLCEDCHSEKYSDCDDCGSEEERDDLEENKDGNLVCDECIEKDSE